MGREETKVWIQGNVLPQRQRRSGLPDLRSYQISFEIAKLAKHWIKENKMEWVIVEYKTRSPFIPTDSLSQSQHSSPNPIRIHKMLKIPHCRQSYSFIWYNSTIAIGRTPIYWKKWHLNRLCHIGDLYQDGVFMS